MILIENILYIEFADFIKAGWKEDTIKKANLRNGSFWMMIANPADARMVLVQYDTLRPKDKSKLELVFGNPYEYMAKAPIKALVQHDYKAETFYTNHQFANGGSLPPQHIKDYTKAASWLNMIISCNDNKQMVKKTLNLPIVTFYAKVGEIIDAEGIKIPSCYKRLRETMKEYQAKSYECLIDWKFGAVPNAKKVTDDVAESLLLEMIANSSQHDDVKVSIEYNAWAKANNRKPITDRTVCNYRNVNKPDVIMQREGREEYVNKFSKNVKRMRPSQPLYLVESDDNHLDFWFTDWEDKTSHRHYHKFKAMVVTDSYNDYVLGYAVGAEINNDLVKQAYQNAIHHIKQLTGNYIIPHQIMTDRFGIKELEPFYCSIANYFKTPVGSKKRGYLEQFFGSTHWERCAKDGTNNYTGHNLTAATAGVNMEELKLQAKNYPTVQEAPQFIADFFNRLRLMPQANGISKQAQWLAAVQAMPQDDLKIISEEQFLLKLGTLRTIGKTAKPQINTITTNGLDITINDRKYNYDIPEKYYYKWKGKEVNTIIDSNDLSRIMVTDFNTLRFIATEPILQPSALRDYKPGDRERLNQRLNDKLVHVQSVVDKKEKRQAILTQSGIDVTALLRSPYMLKADRQAAELQQQRGEMVVENGNRNIDTLSKM